MSPLDQVSLWRQCDLCSRWVESWQVGSIEFLIGVKIMQGGTPHASDIAWATKYQNIKHVYSRREGGGMVRACLSVVLCWFVIMLAAGTTLLFDCPIKAVT